MNNNRNNPESKGAKKPLDSNLITIIIAAVAAVVLIAILVPTIIALNKNSEKMDEFKAQLDEVKNKVDSVDTVSSEELQTAISEAIAGIKIPEGGLTEAQAKAIIDAAIAGIEIPDAGLTEEQVTAIIGAAVEGLASADSVLTEAQIKDIVSAAVEGLATEDSVLTKEQIKEIVDAAVEGLATADSVLTAEEVKAIVDAAIAGIEFPEAALTEEKVQAIIDAAIAGIEFPEAALTEEKVQAIIDAAIAGIEMPAAGLTAEEIKAIVDEAVGAIEIPEAGLTAEEVQAIIDAAIAGIEFPEATLTEEKVQAIIDAAVAGIEIPEAGVSAEEVKAIVEEALNNINTGVTAEEVEQIIADLLEELFAQKSIEESFTVGEDYTLSADTVLSESVIVPAGAAMILDLNGFDLVVDDFAVIDVAGTLCIVDTDGSGSISKDSLFSMFGNVTGTLSINGVDLNDVEEVLNTFIANDSVYLAGCVFNNAVVIDKNENEVSIDLLDTVSFGNFSGLDIPEGINATIELNGDTLKLSTNAIRVSGDVEINGNGTIEVIGNLPFTVNEGGSLTINEAEIVAYEALLQYFVSTTSDVNLEACTIEFEGFSTQFMEISRFENETDLTFVQSTSFFAKYNVPAGNTLNIDLAGYSFTMEVTSGFTVGGTLNLVGGSNIWVRSYQSDAFAVQAGGELNVEALTIQCETSDGKYVFANNGGSIVIDSSILEVYTDIPGITVTKVVINNVSGDVTAVDSDILQKADKEDELGIVVDFTDYVNGAITVA